MTREQRIEELHTRIRNRSRRKERTRTTLLGLSCLLPIAGLILLAAGSGGLIGPTTDMYTGSSMLLHGYGGYVLVGVAAFLIGVVLTVIIRNHLERKKDSSKKK